MDIAQLGIDVDSRKTRPAITDLQALARQGQQTGQQVSTSMTEIEQSTGRMADQQVRARAANDVLSRSLRGSAASTRNVIDGITGVARATQQASASAEEWANDLNRQSVAFDQLRASIDPVFAASKKYESAVEQANSAVRAGIVSQEEANLVLQQAANRYLALDAAVEGLNAPMTTTARGAGRLTGAMTNASFQVQDFAVQVAAGTSATQALSQQLPQLLGAFGFAGRIALIGAGLGTIAAIAVPVISALARKANAARDSEAAFETLGGALSEYISITDNASASLEELSERFGDNARAVRDNYSALADLAALQAVEALQGAVRTLDGDLSRVADNFAAVLSGRIVDRRAIRSIENDLRRVAAEAGTTTEGIITLQSAFERLQSAEGLEGSVEAAQALHDTMIDVFGSTERIPPEMREVARQALQAANSGYEIQASLDGSARAAAAANSNAGALSGTLGGAVGQAAALARNLAAAAGAIAAVSGATASINLQTVGLEAQNRALEAGNDLLESRAQAQIAQRQAELSGALGSGEAAIRAAARQELDAFTAATDRNTQAQRSNIAAVEAANEALAGGGGGGGGGGGSPGGSAGAARAASREMEALNKEIEALEFNADPIKKYNAEIDRLNKLLANGLSVDAYRRAVDELNKGLASSVPLVDDVASAFGNFVANGFRDFQGFVSSVLDSFKRMLAEMIATAARNRILVGIGLAPSGAQAGGVLGGLLGGGGSGQGLLGGLFGSIGGGFRSVIDGFSSGGFGGAFSAIGNAFKGITSGLGGLGTAIGAAIPVIGAVGLIFSAFKSKTTLLDSGLRATIEGVDATIETFEYIEKSRFFGLSRSRRYRYRQAGEDVADPVIQAIGDVLDGVRNAAEVLALDTQALADFRYQFQISTRGLNDDQIQQAIQNELRGAADAAASLIVGTVQEVVTRSSGALGGRRFQGDSEDQRRLLQPIFDALAGATTETVTLISPMFGRLMRDGESVSQTLERLAADLTTANAAFDALGQSTLEAGLNTADAASAMILAAGGTDAFQESVSAFFSEFYSQEEQLARATDQLRGQFREIGIAMPRTRDQFRAMLEAIDRTSVGGAELYGELISLSAAFASITPAATGLSAALGNMASGILERLEIQINGITTRLRDWQQASSAIGSALRSASREFSALVDGPAGLASRRSDFRATLLAARRGDSTAASNLSAVTRNFQTAISQTARTRVEEISQNAAIIRQLESADVRAVSQVDLLSDQVTLLEEARDILASGEFGSAALEALADRLMPGFAGISMAIDSLAVRLMADEARSSGAGAASAVNDAMTARNIRAAQSQLEAAVQANAAARDAVSQLTAQLQASRPNRTSVINAEADRLVGLGYNASFAQIIARRRGDDLFSRALEQWETSNGGLRDRLADARGDVTQTATQVANLRSQILELGGVPAFRRGGMHLGGLRIVGEDGPEIEATGPARYFSSQQTAHALGIDMLAQEVRELRRENSMFRAEQRQLQLQIEKNTYASARHDELEEFRARQAEAGAVST